MCNFQLSWANVEINFQGARVLQLFTFFCGVGDVSMEFLIRDEENSWKQKSWKFLLQFINQNYHEQMPHDLNKSEKINI